MLRSRFTWRNNNIVHTLLRCRSGHIETVWQMVKAIPRELSLGYWLRIERTLPTHYWYAMMTIHMRGYYFEETKQKGVYHMQTIYTVDRTCENAKLHVVVIEFVISNFWIYPFSVIFSYFQFRWISVSCCSLSSVEPCQPQFRWEARLLLSSVELQYGHCDSNAYDARASRLCA